MPHWPIFETPRDTAVAMPHWPIFDTPRDTTVAGIAVVANVDTDDEGIWRRMNSPNAASPGGTAVAMYRDYDTSPLSDELVSYCAHNFHLRAFDPVTGKSSSNFMNATMSLLDGIAGHYVRILVLAGLLTPGRITRLRDTFLHSDYDELRFYELAYDMFATIRACIRVGDNAGHEETTFWLNILVWIDHPLRERFWSSSNVDFIIKFAKHLPHHTVRTIPPLRLVRTNLSMAFEEQKDDALPGKLDDDPNTEVNFVRPDSSSKDFADSSVLRD